MKKIFLILLMVLVPSCAYAITFKYTGGTLRYFSSGTAYGIALKTDGTLWEWGGNNYGNLGDDSYTSWPTVKQLGALTTWKEVLGGQEHSRAIQTDGTMWAWGKNQFGQIGDETTTNRTVPVKIGSATNWYHLYKGLYQVYATDTSNNLWLWGNNEYGQLGYTSSNSCINDASQTVNCQTSPVRLSTEAYSMATGGLYFSILLKADGTIWGSGYNALYQLGLNDTVNRSTFTQIGNSNEWGNVSSGQHFTLALRQNGTLWSWGYNEYGQTGNGGNDFVTTPTQVGSAVWVSISAGYSFSMGVKSNGTLWTWGKNDKGQLGLGNNTSYNTPQQVGTDTNWAQVSAGAAWASAMKSDGTVYTWGSADNIYAPYSTGQNTMTNLSVPTLLRQWKDVYVSPTGGTNKLGTKADPYNWTTLRTHWADYESGNDHTTVWLFGGTYTEQMKIRHNSATNTLFIKPCSASPSPSGCSDMVILSGMPHDKINFGDSGTAKYVTIDGETTSGSGTRNIKVLPGNFTIPAQATVHSEDSNGSHIKITYLEFKDARQDYSDPSESACYQGTRVGGVCHINGSIIELKYGTDYEVSYCYFYDNWCWAENNIVMDFSLSEYGRGLFHHNIIDKGSVNGLVTTANMDVYNNVFEMQTSFWPYDGIHIFAPGVCGDCGREASNGIRYMRIWNNYFNGPDQFVFFENFSDGNGGDNIGFPTQHIRLYNNTFSVKVPESDIYHGRPISFKNAAPIADYQSAVDDVLVANNTYYNLSGAQTFTPGTTQVLTNVKWVNNLVYVDSTESYYNDSFFLYQENFATTWSSTDHYYVSNNMYYNTHAFQSWYRPIGGSWTNYSTMASFNTAVGHTNFQDNPLFAETTNFTISASSPAIGQGIDLTSWLSTSPGITSDKNGVYRGGTWDIGAYQYQSGTPLPPDLVQPNVSITTANPSAITTDSLTITGTASDNVGVTGCKFRMASAPTAALGNACTGTTSWSCSTSGYASGANTMYVGCGDAAGNWGSSSIIVNYTATPPAVAGNASTGVIITGGKLE